MSKTFTILHSNDIHSAFIGMGSDLEVICFLTYRSSKPLFRWGLLPTT